MFYIYKTDFKNHISSANVTYDAGSSAYYFPYNTTSISNFNEYNCIVIEPYTGVNEVEIVGKYSVIKRTYKHYTGYEDGAYIQFGGYIDSDSYISAIAKYSYSGFLEFKIHSNKVEFIKRYGDDLVTISTVPYITPTKTFFTVKLIANYMTYELYINGDYVATFTLDEPNFGEGFFGIAGSNAKFKDIRINANMPYGYTLNGKASAYLCNSIDNYLVVCSSYDENNSNNVSTTIATTSGLEYMLYCESNDSGKIVIESGTSVYEYYCKKGANYYKFTAASNSTTIKLVPLGTTYLTKYGLIEKDYEPFVVTCLQVTNTSYKTGRVKTFDSAISKNKSTVILNTKASKNCTGININSDIKVYDFINNTEMAILSMKCVNDDDICLYLYNGKVSLRYVDSGTIKYVDTGLTVDSNEYFTLKFGVAIKDSMLHINIEIGNAKYSTTSATTTVDFSKIYLGCTSTLTYSALNGEVDGLKIYEGDKLKAEYSFNNAIMEKVLGYRINLSPAPRQNAPISVNYEGESKELVRISNYDQETGEFVDYVYEEIEYTGQKYIYVMYDDINYKYYEVTATSETGRVYNAYKVQGNKIQFNISEIDKKNEMNKKWVIRYRPNNAYCVIYDEDDSCYVRLFDYSGKNVVVSYEASNTDYDILENCNLNPVYNHNNYGFITLTNHENIASILDVKITPDPLFTIHNSDALIMIDVYDNELNIVQSADLTLKAKYGTIEIVDTTKDYPIDLKYMAGRYIYRYIPPSSDNNFNTICYLKEVISITENVSGLTLNKTLDIYI